MRDRISIGIILLSLILASHLCFAEKIKEQKDRINTKTEENPTFYFPIEGSSFSKNKGEAINLVNGNLTLSDVIASLEGPGDLSFSLVERYSSKNQMHLEQMFRDDADFPLIGDCYGWGWDYAPAIMVTYPLEYIPHQTDYPATYLRLNNGGWIKYDTYGIGNGHVFPIDGKTKTQLTFLSAGEGYVLRFKDGTKYYFQAPDGYFSSKGVWVLNRITTPQAHDVNLSYTLFPKPNNIYSGNYGLNKIYYTISGKEYGIRLNYSSDYLSNIQKYIKWVGGGDVECKTIASFTGVNWSGSYIRTKTDALGYKTEYIHNDQPMKISRINSPLGGGTYFEYMPSIDPWYVNVSRRYERDAGPHIIQDYRFLYNQPGKNIYTLVINNNSNDENDTTGYSFDQGGLLRTKVSNITKEAILCETDGWCNYTSIKKYYNAEGFFEFTGDLFSTISYTYDNTVTPDADKWGLVTRIDGAMGERKDITHDTSFHQVTSVKTWLDETNYSMQYFDINGTNGNVNSALLKYGTGDPSVPTNDGDDIYTQFNYCANGNLKNIIDPNLGRKAFTYDENGIYILADSTLVSNDPLVKLTSTMSRNQLTGLVETITDPNNKTYNYTYDDLNRPLAQTNPDASQRTVQYHDPEPLGDKMFRITTTDEDGKVTKRLYDELGRVKQVKTIDIDWERSIIVDQQYDQESRLWKVSDPWTDLEPANYDVIVPVPANVKYTEYYYDQLGRKTGVKRQDGTYIFYSYTYGNKPGLDGTYYIVTTTDPKGYLSKKYIDKSGRLKAFEDAAGALTVNCFNRAGQLTSVTNPKNEATSFTYDVVGRRIGAYYPDGNHAEFQYDNNGNLRFKLKPNKFASNADYIEYKYDLANRLTEYGTKNTAGTYAKKVGFKFSGLYLDSVSDPSGWQAYQYNNRGFVVKNDRKLTALGKTYSIRYDYSPAGSMTGMLYPSGYYAKHERDGHNRLTEISDGNDLCVLGTYAYNDRNQLSQRSYANGTIEAYGYNALGFLSSDYITKGQNQLFGHEYYYDPNGNLVEDYCPDMASSDPDYELASYHYDNTNRLVFEDYAGGPINYNQTYQYNSASERTATTKNGQNSSYVYGLAGKLNQVSGANPMTFGYDANGNTISIATAYGTATLGYDYLDRLASWAKSDTTITYSYDALGHKIFRQMTTGAVSQEKDIVGNGLKPGSLDDKTERQVGIDPGVSLDLVQKTVKYYYLWDLNGKLICDLDQYGKYLKTYYYDSRGRMAAYKTVNQNVTENWGFELGNVQYPETPWYMWAPDNQTPNCNWTITSNSRTGRYALNAGPFTATTHETYAQNVGAMTAPLNASCYIKGQDLSGGARLVVECWASNYTVFKGSFSSTILTGTFGWTLVNLPISSLPIGTQTLKVTLQRLNGGGHVWFDDVRCEKGSARKSDSLYFYHGDRLGTVRLLTDESGNVTWHQSTTAFGENLSNMLGNNYKFTGMEIEDNGLYNFNARYYMPQIGRFISSDPIRPTINYIYSLQNPTKYIDPTGFYDEDGGYDYEPYYPYQGDDDPGWHYYDDGRDDTQKVDKIYILDVSQGAFVEYEREYYTDNEIDIEYGGDIGAYSEGIGLEYEKIIGEGVTWETPAGRIRAEEYISVAPKDDRQITFSQDPLEVQVGPFYLSSEPLHMGRIGVEIPIMDFNFMGMQFEYGINVEYEATMLEATIGLGSIGACILGGEGYIIVPMLQGAYAR